MQFNGKVMNGVHAIFPETSGLGFHFCIALFQHSKSISLFFFSFFFSGSSEEGGGGESKKEFLHIFIVFLISVFFVCVCVCGGGGGGEGEGYRNPSAVLWEFEAIPICHSAEI